MDLENNLNAISEKYYSPWMTILRILTGLIIWIKGYMFMIDTSVPNNILMNYFGSTSTAIALVIAGIHLFTGFFLIGGFMTRVSCVILFPFVVGALFYMSTHFIEVRVFDIFLTALTLGLIAFNFVMGSGKFSVYYYMILSRKSRESHKVSGADVEVPITHSLDKQGNIM